MRLAARERSPSASQKGTEELSHNAAPLLPVRSEAVPRTLKARSQFVLWRLDGNGKKLPVDFDGNPCDPNNPMNWMGFPEAVGAYHTRSPAPDGIGFALADSGHVVIDWDNTIDEVGRISSDAQNCLDAFRSYAERSPRARGMHIVIEAKLPGGNRRLPGIELLGRGFATVTGHVIQDGPIVAGGPAWERLLARLPPRPANLAARQIEPIAVPSRSEIETVRARAMTIPRFRKLWAGDWSDYPSRSEADAALCAYAVLNGADLAIVIALLRHSGLRRPKLRRDDYCTRTALLPLMTLEVRTAPWPGMAVADEKVVAENTRRQQAITRLEQHPSLGREARWLTRLAAEIAARLSQDDQSDGGFLRVSPQRLSGDYRPSPELPNPQRIMSRQAMWKALHRLANRGVFDLRQSEGQIIWRKNGRERTRVDAVTMIRVDGGDVCSIIDGFIARADRSAPASPARPPPYLCLSRL